MAVWYYVSIRGVRGALAEDVGRVAASAAKVADSQWSQKIYENHHIMNFYAKLMSHLSFLAFKNESLRNNLVTT